MKSVGIRQTELTAFDLLLLPKQLLLLSELSFTHLLSPVHTVRTSTTLGLHSRVQAAVKQCSYMHET